MLTRLKRLILGQPLSNQLAVHERLPKWKALSSLSSDALSSVAYATDAILLVLAGFSAAAAAWSIPIAMAITLLLVILTFSYRQTIEAYPSGGGAYIVAKDNLGTYAGLVAGASLLIDYVLTVSVSVASGVDNIAAAMPFLQAHKLAIETVVVTLIMIMNLRGIRESATVFAFPTYFFIFSIFLMLAVGTWQWITGGVVEAAPLIHAVYPSVPMILVLRAFASGCSALTGVEAISNGIQVFRQPSQKNAKTTLVWMSLILGAMFMGITALAHAHHLVITADQTIISLLGHAIYGNSVLYYSTQVATALILFLAANTSYADFPRLASLLAKDRFLPRQLTNIGDRLVFSNGILGLSLAAILVIFLFHGDTDSMLPLYALGVFLSFTLSQAGMVIHHIKEREPNWFRSLLINATGSLTTLVVLADITMAKFMHGAWIVVLMIPFLVFIYTRIHQHYLAVGRELTLAAAEIQPADVHEKVKHTVIIPVSGVHRGVLEAVRYATSISDDVRACYVELDPTYTDSMIAQWNKWVPHVPFVVLKSPYRSVIQPLLNYIDDVEQTSHDDLITVVVPEFVTSKWWHRLLHNQTALFIRAALAFKRGKVVTSVRYHLKNA